MKKAYRVRKDAPWAAGELLIEQSPADPSGYVIVERRIDGRWRDRPTTEQFLKTWCVEETQRTCPFTGDRLMPEENAEIDFLVNSGKNAIRITMESKENRSESDVRDGVIYMAIQVGLKTSENVALYAEWELSE
jgi:hypothetical protein